MQETLGSPEHWQLLTDILVGFFLDPMPRDSDLVGLGPMK